MFSNLATQTFASPQIADRRMSTSAAPFMDSEHYFEEFQQALNSEPFFSFSNTATFPFDSPMPLPLLLQRTASQVQASQAMPAPTAPIQNARTQYPNSTLRSSDLDPLFDNNGIYDFIYDGNPSPYRPPSEIPFTNFYNPNSNNSRASPPRASPPFPNMYPTATKRPIDNSMTINYSLQQATRNFHSNAQTNAYYQSRQTLPSVNSHVNSNMYSQNPYITQNSQSVAPLPTIDLIPTFAQSMPYASTLTDDQKASIPNSFVWENYIESVNNPAENQEDWSDGEDGTSSSYDVFAEDTPFTCSPASETDEGTESKKRRRGRVSTKSSNQPRKIAKLVLKSKTIKQEESMKKMSSTQKITATLLKSYPADSLNVIVVGTYTRAERAARIARYRVKRSQRRWEKKILYNCRKSFADNRPRVGGRFVKMS